MNNAANNATQHRNWIFGVYWRVAVVALAWAIVLVPALVATRAAEAQTNSVLYSFTGPPDGADPTAGLVVDAQGNLYGTTYLGGAQNLGTVFKIDTTGKETVLHSFAGAGAGDGANPDADLLLDAHGNLYGTTAFGGGKHNGGTVFKMDMSGNETILYDFGTEPNVPRAGLVMDSQGNLYGTTVRGGIFDYPFHGTVFKLDTTGLLTVLLTLSAVDGRYPHSRLVLDAQGNLYGTAEQGGCIAPAAMEWCSR